MVEFSEYQRYIRIYQRKMRQILKARGVKVPESARHNIVALEFLMMEYGMLEEYPLLKQILEVVSDELSSPEHKLNMLRFNAVEAFKIQLVAV